MFAGEPQSVQVDGRTQTQILQGLIPDTRYEVTVVSVRGFEESEPLTGFLTTGKRDSPQHEER
jgi:syndecan 4